MLTKSAGWRTLGPTVHALAEAGKDFYRRGWVLGTSGNFSAVASREPLRLVITPSGADKGNIVPDQFLLVDQDAQVQAGEGRPSAETQLHLAIAQDASVGCILHTHSVWATILSEYHAAHGGFYMEGYEMLKGLARVHTHSYSEWVPILDNSQNYFSLSQKIVAAMARFPASHGILLRRHGLYTWGETIVDARRHVEILEFLFEAEGRLLSLRRH